VLVLRINLGELIQVLDGLNVCVDECDEECGVCVWLPSWVEKIVAKIGERGRISLALYVVGRYLLDYQVIAAWWIFIIRNDVILFPEFYERAFREMRIVSKISRSIEDDSVFAWYYVRCRGVRYGETKLDLEDRLVVVKVEAMKDKRERERLRVLLEGRKRNVRGRIRRTAGLIESLGGVRLAPWVYLVPKRAVSEIRRAVGDSGVIRVFRDRRDSMKETLLLLDELGCGKNYERKESVLGAD